jgi:hypothetical protein
MQFLKIKSRIRQRKDGREWAEALVVEKTQKYGNVIEEKSISTRRPVLITGAHASGKTRWLTRLRKDAGRIWASRNAEPLHLAAVASLAEWIDCKSLELWWAGRDNPDDDRHWSKLKPHEKYRALPLYLRESGAVLFIDDAHKLTGKKAEIAKECIRAAGVWVMAAQDEGRLHPTLRHDVIYSKPQIFRLDSEVAYDATPAVMWLLMFIAVGLGYWELAMALGGLKMLGSGRRAAKQA